MALFLRSIFLCFLFEANEVRLPVATWARHSDTKGNLTSHSQSRTASLQHPLNNHLHHPPSASPKTNMHTCNDTRTQMQTCSYTHTVYGSARAISWTFVINSHSGPMFTAYLLSKPQTCLFLLSQNSKHPLSKDFFLSLACLFFPPTCLEVTH